MSLGHGLCRYVSAFPVGALGGTSGRACSSQAWFSARIGLALSWRSNKHPFHLRNKAAHPEVRRHLGFLLFDSVGHPRSSVDRRIQ